MMTLSLPGLRAPAAVALAVLGPLLGAQDARPQPYAITNVSLDRTGEDEARWTLVVRDGRIAAIQPAEADVPPGLRSLDAAGALALPAFLDAYTRKGCETPEPVKDQDVPVDEGKDVRIDMRAANRKGIQPAFRSAAVLNLEAELVEAWNEAGFGVAHVCPSGELLAGSGTVAAVREAAARDLVIAPELFAHGAFRASGSGYPGTLMGYTAQLRQFFLDARRHDALTQRRAQGKPGLRPPYDEELASGVQLLDGKRRLVCEAETARDIERWMRLGAEFDLALAISGGREAWRVAEDLAASDVPVFLTLDWGEEVDDPFEKEKEQEEGPEHEVEPPAEPDTTPDGTETEEPQADAGTESPEGEDEEGAEADEDEEEALWEYEEPLAVRAERRRLWEEDRDSALRLHQLGVPFAFGTAGGSPDELLEKVRTLVEAGLPPEAALEGLTGGAARLLGLDGRLGELAVGKDATFCLWQGDPLTDEKAQVSWIFVDGFQTEFEVEPGLEGEPAEGVDLGGTWVLRYKRGSEDVEATLVLEMTEDGAVSGSFAMDSPFGEGTWESDVTGQVAGHEAELDLLIEVQDFKIPIELRGTIEGDELEGKLISRPSWSEESETRTFRATKNDPERRTSR